MLCTCVTEEKGCELYEYKWYKTLRRWGQTNLTEIDPEICGIGWWKEFWKKIDTQGPVKITFKLDDFTLYRLLQRKMMVRQSSQARAIPM